MRSGVYKIEKTLFESRCMKCGQLIQKGSSCYWQVDSRQNWHIDCKPEELPVLERKPKPNSQKTGPIAQLPPEPVPLTAEDQDKMLVDARKEVLALLNIPEERIVNFSEVLAQKYNAKLQSQSQRYWLQYSKFEHALKERNINRVKGR